MDRMIACTNCHYPYPDEGIPFQCPRCKGIFDFTDPVDFNSSRAETDLPGIWRFRHLFGIPSDVPEISLGEGNTPLIWSEIQNHKIGFKLEYLNPTGSFKDRGTSPLMSFLSWRGTTHAIEDSSGNAGASFAAYAARAGIQARVYVPESASGPKRSQIDAYGAEVILVPGSRANAAEAARLAAEQGEVYASHAYLPFNLPGYATVAYEIFEQMGAAPGTVICPVGQGGLLLGIGRGFLALQRSGVIPEAPRLIGVQALACAPLWALFQYGAEGLMWVSEGETLAEGVRVRYPLRGDTVLRTVEESGGFFIAIDEGDILTGRDQLARRGFYVEATSAIVWKALMQVIDGTPEPIVVMLTGSGFKSNA